MIVATAGHIDHGKTTLVKALTGVDTDRLPEEKARGISIDLGFAYWHDPATGVIGFVDVPGHERFVRNMLAGVCAIDMVLLVVAADDGVMPQTREHLNIVDLLNVPAGVVAITKADRVEVARLNEVVSEVRSVVAGTTLETASILPVSTVSGMGMDMLRATLTNAKRAFQRRSSAGRRFRFAIDRVFSVVGSGTVVTGTVVGGAVSAGDRLVISPNGREVRVRGVQKDGVKVASAEVGERCALNLGGVELAQVQRGDWVLHAELHAPAARLDVEVRLLASEKHALQHWTPVHLHLGTCDVTARLSLRRGLSIESGATAFARLAIDRPVVALHGDRFILRDQSARRTLAGGRVLDAFPETRRLPAERRERQLRAFARSAPEDVLRELVACSPAGVRATTFARNLNLDPEALNGVVKRAGLAMHDSGEHACILTLSQVASLRAKQIVPPPAANPEHTRLWQLAQPVLRSAGRAGLTVEALSQQIGAKPAVLDDALRRKASRGDAVQIGDNRFMLRDAMDELISVARALARDAPQGRFTAASFRDLAGIGRTRAIEVLEAMDRLGATKRVGDVRVVNAAASKHLREPGSAEPHKPG